MNGWTNSTTWSAHTTLGNNQATYSRLNTFVKSNDRAGFIAEAKTLWMDSGSSVNWDEIFNAWFEAVYERKLIMSKTKSNEIVKVLNYCHAHIDQMWAATVVAILLDCDFRESKSKLASFFKGVKS